MGRVSSDIPTYEAELLPRQVIQLEQLRPKIVWMVFQDASSMRWLDFSFCVDHFGVSTENYEGVSSDIPTQEREPITRFTDPLCGCSFEDC